MAGRLSSGMAVTSSLRSIDLLFCQRELGSPVTFPGSRPTASRPLSPSSETLTSGVVPASATGGSGGAMSMVTVGVWFNQSMADKGASSCADTGAVLQVNANRTVVNLLHIQRYRLANLGLRCREVRAEDRPEICESHKANGQ